jgi:hypothetical protein
MSRKSKAEKGYCPSLAWFARQTDPFQTPELILRRLKSETSESKFLEWKQTPPIGSNVTLRTKYRVVKAIVSFANTEGGFVVFGIGNKGEWIGFTRSELQQTDAAALAELINGCISPEITGINYAQLKDGERIFPILHVPPSGRLPHVTTKDIQEKLPDGQHVFHLNKHAVYCRYTAKSDLATPSQYERIISFRTEYLRAEMLRRVKEIELPSFQPNPKSGGASSHTILRVSYGSKDPSLPAVRITRNPSEATGLIVQEELSGAIFEEINNVVNANNLLANNRPEFVMGEEIYYRIYAERQHVLITSASRDLLVGASTRKFYGPALYWVLRLAPSEIVQLMENVLQKEKSIHNRFVCRLAVLIGPRVASWLKDRLDRQWAKHPQPPEHYFAYKKMLAKRGRVDPRLVALQIGINSDIELPAEGKTVSSGKLLESSQLVGVSLSKACLAVFNGDKSQRSLCRFLDVMTYGAEFAEREEAVSSVLETKKE